jgi:hypothetical protein
VGDKPIALGVCNNIPELGNQQHHCQKQMTLSWAISNTIAKNMTHFLFFERNLGWAVKLFVAE